MQPAALRLPGRNLPVHRFGPAPAWPHLRTGAGIYSAVEHRGASSGCRPYPPLLPVSAKEYPTSIRRPNGEAAGGYRSISNLFPSKYVCHRCHECHKAHHCQGRGLGRPLRYAGAGDDILGTDRGDDRARKEAAASRGYQADPGDGGTRGDLTVTAHRSVQAVGG